MTFGESISTCLKKYAEFNGRAGRPEFWWFALFSLLVQAAGGILGQMIGGLLALALLLPSIAVGARRLHDVGKSGWLQLIGIIPLIGWIVLIYFFVQPSAAGANPYDAAPEPGASS